MGDPGEPEPGCTPPSQAVAKLVMLATECSKPQAMRANKHQKIKMPRAASELARSAVQSARQTSQLHRMPRARSASAPDSAS